MTCTDISAGWKQQYDCPRLLVGYSIWDDSQLRPWSWLNQLPFALRTPKDKPRWAGQLDRSVSDSDSRASLGGME